MTDWSRVTVHLDRWSIEDLQSIIDWHTGYCAREIAGMGDRYVPLYESGVRYRREQCEYMQGPRRLRARGVGDCDDLAANRAAELVVLFGLEARAVVQPTTPGSAHVVVWCRLPDGTETWEDPSVILGMGGAA